MPRAGGGGVRLVVDGGVVLHRHLLSIDRNYFRFVGIFVDGRRQHRPPFFLDTLRPRFVESSLGLQLLAVDEVVFALEFGARVEFHLHHRKLPIRVADARGPRPRYHGNGGGSACSTGTRRLDIASLVKQYRMPKLTRELVLMHVSVSEAAD